MINDKINDLIKEAMKAHQETRKEVLRIIKSKFLEWSTDSKNIGKTMTAGDESKILQKLKKEYLDAKENYLLVGNQSESDLCALKADIISEFIPKEPGESDILEALEKYTQESGLSKTMKDMGKYMSFIRESLPGADGKTVSQIVKKYLS